MSDLRYPLSTIIRHSRPIVVEVKRLIKGAEVKKTFSVQELLEYVIKRFVYNEEALLNVNYDVERIIFEDGSNCYGSYFLQKKFANSKDKIGVPYAVYLCAGASKGECFIASMLIE